MRVGVIGGGQLARMMIAPAVEMGIDIRVLAEAPEMSADLAATEYGDYRDVQIVRAFAREVDVITFDHEHVPQSVLRALRDDGVAVHPGPDALQYAQDKIVMRTRLQELGIPQPEWAAVADTAQLQDFLDAHSDHGVVKTPRGGYDGKGVKVVTAAEQAAEWFDVLAEGEFLLVEERVDFQRELAQQVARCPSGRLAVYPVVQTVQKNGVCAEVYAPAPECSEAVNTEAAVIAERLASSLEVTGMLAVELFETTQQRVLVNELAMRPHNSGHWTQDGATTSQFEQHLRAVCDLPLGSTDPVSACTTMINILGGPRDGTLQDRFAEALAVDPAVRLHTYGKAARPGRKVGHVNVIGDDVATVQDTARQAAGVFSDE